MAIHTTKSPRTGLSDYCQLPDSYGVKSFSASFKDPVSLFQTFEEAFTYSRKKRLPSFIQIIIGAKVFYKILMMFWL